MVKDNLCELCQENEGVINSKYWRNDDYDEGVWVCLQCEFDLEVSHEEWLGIVREERREEEC